MSLIRRSTWVDDNKLRLFHTRSTNYKDYNTDDTALTYTTC